MNPEDDAEIISSIEEHQDVTSETEASEAWADAKEEADIKVGIKSCCSGCGIDTHTEGQCPNPQVRIKIRGKFLMARTASQVKF